MGLKITLLIVATLACGSAALAGSGGRGTIHFFIVRTPLPIWQAPASTGTVGLGASPSRIDSRVDSRVDSMVYSRVDSRR
jgi:hypothetical protein